MATPTLAPEQPLAALDHVRDRFAAQFAMLLRGETGVRTGEDPLELRRFRVATRRLRALLRAARPLLEPGWAVELRAELAWLARSVASARDLDVLLEHLREASAHFEPGERFVLARMLRTLEEERAAAGAAVLETLDSERYRALLAQLAQEPPCVRRLPADVSLAGLAAAEFRRLRRRRRSLGTEPTDQGLHDLRLLLKRARYAAELAEAEVGAGAKALIRQAKALQDILGEHQDATVTEQRVREMLRRPQSVRYAVAAGRLIERQHMRREQARSAFPAAWKALERQARATWP